MTLTRLPRRAVRAGFTLIELLAVILIIGILAAALSPMVLSALGASEVSACQTNQRNLYQGIILYKNQYKQLPNESGVKFFAQLYSRKAIDQSKANAERLTCPAVDKGALAIGGLPWEEWWADLSLVTGDYSAYAGRDTANHPLRKLASSEALLADDNDPLMNHETTTNVLYGGGEVQEIQLVILQEEGVLGPEDEVLYVGPDSPVPDLQKLTLD